MTCHVWERLITDFNDGQYFTIQKLLKKKDLNVFCVILNTEVDS